MKPTICPKCGSTNVVYDNTVTSLSTGVFPQPKICEDCGYTSYIFPEADKDSAALIKKEVKKNPAIASTVEPKMIHAGRFHLFFELSEVILLALIIIAAFMWW